MLNEGSVNTNVDGLALELGVGELAGLENDGGNGNSRETSSAAANGTGNSLESLGILQRGGIDVKVGLEFLAEDRKLGGGISSSDREDRGIDTPLLEERGVFGNVGGGLPVIGARVLVLEQSNVWLLKEIDDGQSQDLAEVHAGNTLLVHLNAGVGGGLIELDIPWCVGEDLEVVVERTPLGVDDHLTGRVIVLAGQGLLELGELLDVSSVGAGTKDSTEDGTALAGGRVGTSHQSTNSVVDESGNLDGEMKLVNLGLEESTNILSDGVWDVETLGPADECTLINTQLLNGETECETETENVLVLEALGRAHGHASADMGLEVVAVMCPEEDLNLLCQESEQLLSGLGNHELSGDGDLGVCETESGVAVKLDRANTKVGAAKVDSHIEALDDQTKG